MLRRAPGEDPPGTIREAVGRGLALPDRVPDEDSTAAPRLDQAEAIAEPPLGPRPRRLAEVLGQEDRDLELAERVLVDRPRPGRRLEDDLDRLDAVRAECLRRAQDLTRRRGEERVKRSGPPYRAGSASPAGSGPRSFQSAWT